VAFVVHYLARFDLKPIWIDAVSGLYGEEARVAKFFSRAERNFLMGRVFRMITTLRMVVKTTEPSDVQLAPAYRRAFVFAASAIY
jgi:hypothetical protein